MSYMYLSLCRANVVQFYDVIAKLCPHRCRYLAGFQIVCGGFKRINGLKHSEPADQAAIVLSRRVTLKFVSALFGQFSKVFALLQTCAKLKCFLVCSKCVGRVCILIAAYQDMAHVDLLFRAVVCLLDELVSDLFISKV